jgi:hypothetical protein
LFTSPEFNFTDTSIFEPKLLDLNPKLHFDEQPITISRQDLIDYSDKISEIIPNDHVKTLMDRIMKNETEWNNLRNIKEDD